MPRILLGLIVDVVAGLVITGVPVHHRGPRFTFKSTLTTNGRDSTASHSPTTDGKVVEEVSSARKDSS